MITIAVGLLGHCASETEEIAWLELVSRQVSAVAFVASTGPVSPFFTNRTTSS